MVSGAGSKSGEPGSASGSAGGGRGILDNFCGRLTTHSDDSNHGVVKSLAAQMMRPASGDQAAVITAMAETVRRMEQNSHAQSEAMRRLDDNNKTLMAFIEVNKVKGQHGEHAQQAGCSKPLGMPNLISCNATNHLVFVGNEIRGDNYATDSEEFEQAELEVLGIDKESSNEEEEDASEISDRFGATKKRHVPEQMAEFLWGQARKAGSDFTEDEWKTVNQTSLIRGYNSHPDAVMFSAPLADVECPDLKFKEKVDLEKQVSFVSFRRFAY